MELQEAVDKYNTGELTTEEFENLQVVKDSGIKFWITERDRNPKYPEGNNESRVGAIYNCFHHVKGIFFQNVLKPTITKTLNFIHTSMIKEYDNEVFVYDDPRLKALDIFLKEYIDVNFTEPRKNDFMKKAIDIGLGLMKEDIYYRARGLDFAQKFKEKFPNMLISPTEQENIKRWK